MTVYHGNSGDLVKRLRDNECKDIDESDRLTIDAADRIEALEAINAANADATARKIALIKSHETSIEALKADVKRLREQSSLVGKELNAKPHGVLARLESAERVVEAARIADRVVYVPSLKEALAAIDKETAG